MNYSLLAELNTKPRTRISPGSGIPIRRWSRTERMATHPETGHNATSTPIVRPGHTYAR